MAAVHLLCDFLIRRTSLHIGSRFFVVKKKQWSAARLTPLFSPQLKKLKHPFQTSEYGTAFLKIWMRIRWPTQRHLLLTFLFSLVFTFDLNGCVCLPKFPALVWMYSKGILWTCIQCRFGSCNLSITLSYCLKKLYIKQEIQNYI